MFWKKLSWQLFGKTILILLLFISTIVNANTVLITAATGSFGKAISFNCAAEGSDLILTGRDQKKLQTLKDSIISKYNNLNISTVLVDFSDVYSIKSAIENIKSTQIDGVVLIGPRPNLSQDTIPSPEEWNNAFNETFINPLEFLKQLVPNISEKGSIIIVCGSSSKEYSKEYPNTNVIRLAWVGEVKNLIHFLSEKKIRVNAISPGPILTKFHLDMTVDKDQLDTYGTLNDVCNLINFLLSDNSKHINGTNILLDGGKSNLY